MFDVFSMEDDLDDRAPAHHTRQWEGDGQGFEFPVENEIYFDQVSRRKWENEGSKIDFGALQDIILDSRRVSNTSKRLAS